LIAGTGTGIPVGTADHAVARDATRDDVVDVAIIGAGVIGASCAYWLTRLDPSLSVVLVERDTGFSTASSSLSASSIRQQFSSPVNIAMSQFGISFLREAHDLLAVDGEPASVSLVEPGYLYLAQPGPAADALRALNAVQRAQGADIALLAPDALALRFPWLEVGDIEVGSLGLTGEGWFDGPALHASLLRKARAQGARLVRGEVGAFDLDPRSGRVDALRLADGTRIACSHAVNAAGPWARRVAAMAGIELPVHARRRTVFVLSCPQPLPGCPLLIDPSGFWFRPEGHQFIAGTTPDPDVDDLPLEANLAEFDEALWMRLAHRVPAFEALRVERAWAGYYEMNGFDHNAVIGAHPDHPNLLLANGFSGHGMQQAPAAGRGIAELVLHGRFRTLDLAPLGVERLARGERLLEANVIG
jgi:FAD-dependent oxidoreductase domain-containing protein 1